MHHFIRDFCLPSAPASSGNGDFGDWNAFPAAQPAVPAAQPVNSVGIDLFSGLQAAPAPASMAPSSDLFDLMGSSQTTNFSTSQSMNFSMTTSQTIGLPTSKSQVPASFEISLNVSTCIIWKLVLVLFLFEAPVELVLNLFLYFLIASSF